MKITYTPCIQNANHLPKNKLVFEKEDLIDSHETFPIKLITKQKHYLEKNVWVKLEIKRLIQNLIQMLILSIIFKLLIIS